MIVTHHFWRNRFEETHDSVLDLSDKLGLEITHLKVVVVVVVYSSIILSTSAFIMKIGSMKILNVELNSCMVKGLSGIISIILEEHDIIDIIF